MDQNNGLEAKISKEAPLMPTRISLQDPTLSIGVKILILEDRMTNAQISHSIETMETDLEMDLSTIRMGTGRTMESFLVLLHVNRPLSWPE